MQFPTITLYSIKGYASFSRNWQISLIAAALLPVFTASVAADRSLIANRFRSYAIASS